MVEPKTLTPEQILELKELAAAATPGPWTVRPLQHDDWGVIRSAQTEEGFHPIVAHAREARFLTTEELDSHRRARTDPYAANAAFIASSREAVPALIEMVEGLEADAEEQKQQHRNELNRLSDAYRDCIETAEASLRRAGELEAALKALRGLVQEGRGETFDYCECPECGFSSVQRSDFTGGMDCPLCAGDSGHNVAMTRRTALPADKPEGFDARLGTRDEQRAASPAPAPGEGKERYTVQRGRTGGWYVYDIDRDDSVIWKPEQEEAQAEADKLNNCLASSPPAPGEPKLDDFQQDAAQLPDIEHRMPSNLFKWLATIDAHAKGCLEDGGAGSLDAMACIRHNVRHLIEELRPLDAALSGKGPAPAVGDEQTSLAEALRRVDYTLTAHGKVDADTPLHDFIRSALSRIPASGEGR